METTGSTLNKKHCSILREILHWDIWKFSSQTTVSTDKPSNVPFSYNTTHEGCSTSIILLNMRAMSPFSIILSEADVF